MDRHQRLENNDGMNEELKTKVILLSIGDELLIGQTENTNAGWIARKLGTIGLEVVEMRTLRDEREIMLEALAWASERGDLIVLTGGLGPTRDDLTAEVLADYCGVEMSFNEEVFNWIKQYKEEQKQKVNDLHRKQAVLPEGFTYFKNNRGTAPGMAIEKDDKILIALPGVPYEMQKLFTEDVLPFLKDKVSGRVIKSKTILTAGLPESEIAGALEDFENDLPIGVSLAYLPGLVRVRIRLTVKGESDNEAEQTLRELIGKLESILGNAIYGSGDQTLESAVGVALKKSGASLSTAESCTGGYISHLITSVSGASDYYKGSVIAYSNEVKVSELRVGEDTLEKHGAVSEETVREMLTGVCDKFKTDLGIAISGIAGPTGGTGEKPVGMVCIAVGSKEKYKIETLYLNQNRLLNIEKSSLLALNMLRLFLLGD